MALLFGIGVIEVLASGVAAGVSGGWMRMASEVWIFTGVASGVGSGVGSGSGVGVDSTKGVGVGVELGVGRASTVEATG